jgi:hypothetical protein
MEKEKIAEIPFWVYDRPKWISGITPSTSCEDILRSLASFLQPEFDSNRKSAKLILTEKWRDVERPLAYDAKILKVPFIYYVSNSIISLTSLNNQFSEFRIFCLFTFLLIFLWNTFFKAHLERVTDGAADCCSYF